MKHYQTPQQKKRDELDKSRYAQAEYPTWFRRHWPQKKARLQRKERKRIRALIQTAQQHANEETLSAALLDTAKPTFRAQKWGAPTLRELIQHKHKNRQQRHGRCPNKRRPNVGAHDDTAKM